MDGRDHALIEPNLWTVWDNRQAQREGWAITFTHDGAPGSAKITRYLFEGTEFANFMSDTQATEFVMERMHQGSHFHTRAWIAVNKAYLNGAK